MYFGLNERPVKMFSTSSWLVSNLLIETHHLPPLKSSTECGLADSNIVLQYGPLHFRIGLAYNTSVTEYLYIELE